MDQPRKQRARNLLVEAQHQLRQPLNALSLLIGELRQAPGDRQLDAIAEDMRSALRLANTWLDALRDLQEAEEGLVELAPQEVPLQTLFAGLAEEFSPRFARHGLELRVVPTRSVAHADPRYLQRLLGRLLDNALKFTGKGKVLLGCRRANGALRVEVWDSGPGIAADQAGRVFEPFFRLDNEVRPRERGLGVGLSYARRLAELAGDELTLRTRPGRGCCFALGLRPARGPVRKGQWRGKAALPPAAPVPNPLQGAQVLLLDGPEAATVRASLESWGLVVRPVAPAALPRALAGGPPLLIAGGEEFDAAGGWLAMRQASEAGRTTVVLIGEAPSKRIEQAGGSLHHLQRPVRPARLRALCHFALSRPGGGALRA